MEIQIHLPHTPEALNNKNGHWISSNLNVCNLLESFLSYSIYLKIQKIRKINRYIDVWNNKPFNLYINSIFQILILSYMYHWNKYTTSHTENNRQICRVATLRIYNEIGFRVFLLLLLLLLNFTFVLCLDR